MPPELCFAVLYTEITNGASNSTKTESFLLVKRRNRNTAFSSLKR